MCRGPLPGGQTFHPQWWGDWLKHDGPDELQAFVTTNIHLVPPQVWEDYQRVINLRSGWEGTLSRYNVTTIIVDQEKQAALNRILKRSNDWRLRYEDEQSAVYVRQSAIETSPREGNAPQTPPTDPPADDSSTGEAA